MSSNVKPLFSSLIDKHEYLPAQKPPTCTKTSPNLFLFKNTILRKRRSFVFVFELLASKYVREQNERDRTRSSGLFNLTITKEHEHENSVRGKPWYPPGKATFAFE